MNGQSRLLSDRIQMVRDDVVRGAPVVTGFHARRSPALCTALSSVLTFILAVLLQLPLVLLTSIHPLLAILIGCVGGQVVSSLLSHGTTRALGFSLDGSVVVARTGLFRGGKVTGIETIYAAPAGTRIEPTTPWWRTQRIVVDGERWYPCSPATKFEQRIKASAAGVSA